MAFDDYGIWQHDDREIPGYGRPDRFEQGQDHFHQWGTDGLEFGAGGRWRGELPYQQTFQANYIADFFENENLTFQQWLVWFRRWIWGLDHRLSVNEAKINTFSRQNTSTITWAMRGQVTDDWNSDLNSYSTPDPYPLLQQANVNVSAAAGNLLSINSDGLYVSTTSSANTPSVQDAAIQQLSAQVSALQNQVSALQSQISGQTATS